MNPVLEEELFPELPRPSCSDRDEDILELFSYAESAGFSGEALSEAVAVAIAESDGNPRAINKNRNGSIDRGVWQINSVHGYDVDKLMDPWYNARAAYEVWDSSGWRAWYAHTPRGGGYGSGKKFSEWLPIVDCVRGLRNG